MSKHLIYLHGFNSSPQSEKAQITRDYFGSTDFKVHVPALPPSPRAAIAFVKSLIAEIEPERVCGFVGSSLGGYYALHLHHHYGLPAVLINPAIKPYELLQDYLGENTNLYTGERYLVEAHHMDELKALEVALDPRSQALYVLTQTGDEVLDYREATDRLNGVPMWVQYGGDHAFESFATVLPSIHSFFSKF